MPVIATIVGWPVAIGLAVWFLLNAEGGPVRVGRVQFLAPYLLITAVVSTFVFLPLAAILKVPVLTRTLLGPPRYRRRWFSLQAAALAGGSLSALVGATFVRATHRESQTLTEAFAIAATPAGLVVLGLYIASMGLMPAGFFDDSPIGRRMRNFVGVDRGADARPHCLVAGAVLLSLSLGFWVLDASVFGS